MGPLHRLRSSEDFSDVMKTDCTDTRRLQTIVFFCKMFPSAPLNWHHSVRVSEGNLLLATELMAYIGYHLASKNSKELND